MKNILTIAIVIIILLLSIYIINYGVSQSEKNECLKWQKESEKYDNYYVLNWQIEQCEHYNIELE